MSWGRAVLESQAYLQTQPAVLCSALLLCLPKGKVPATSHLSQTHSSGAAYTAMDTVIVSAQIF